MAAAPPTTTPALTFQPAPQDKTFYEALFVAADVSRQGKIGGAEAVAFLSKSKLPTEVLRQVWAVAESSKTNFLNKHDFFVAVRLIQLFQNKVKSEGSSLQAPNGVVLNPPFFEGFAAPAPAMPVAPLSPTRSVSTATAPTSGALTTDAYAMSASEEESFKRLFPKYADPVTKKVPGNVAVELFTKSGVETNSLRNIWAMSDVDKDNFLSEKEFCVAMHLIICISKKGLPLPGTLPGALAAYVSGNTGNTAPVPAPVPQVQQQTTVPPPLPTLNTAIGQQQQMSLPSPGSMAPLSNGAFQQQQPSMGSQMQLQQPPPLHQEQTPPVVEDKFSAFDDLDCNSTIQSVSHFSMNNTQPQVNMPVVAENSVPPISMMNTASSVSVGSAPPPVTTVSYSAPAPTPIIPEITEVVSPAPSPIISMADNNTTTVETSNGESALKSLVTKLQAENISLKAKLSLFSGEELSIAEENKKLIADVASLTERLGALREEIAEKRESIASGKAEGNGLQAQKKILQDAISSEEAQLNLMEESKVSQPEPIIQAPAPNATYEVDFFGSEPVKTTLDAPAPKFEQQESKQVSPPDFFGISTNPTPAPVPSQPAATEEPVLNLPPAEPTPEEVARLGELRNATAKISEQKTEAENKLKSLKAAHEEAETNASEAEQAVVDASNSKPKGKFGGGKKKKAKEIETLQNNAELLRQKAFDASQAVKLAEKSVETFENELEAAQVDLVSYESTVEANVQQRTAGEANGGVASDPAAFQSQKPAVATTPSHQRVNTADVSHDMFGLYGGVMGGGNNENDNPFW